MWPLSIAGTKTRRGPQHSFSCNAWGTWFSLKDVEGSGVKKEEARERVGLCSQNSYKGLDFMLKSIGVHGGFSP